MKAAKRAVFGTVAAAVVMLGAPVTAAHADPGDTLTGGCSFDSQPDTTFTGGQAEGVIADSSVSQDASGGPSVATVACWITVNGVEAPGTRITATGNGVQATSAPVTFTARDTDWVGLCQQVTFADGSTWTSPDGGNPFCPVAAGPQFPPQVVVDEIQAVFDVVTCLTAGQICTSVASRPVATAL